MATFTQTKCIGGFLDQEISQISILESVQTSQENGSMKKWLKTTMFHIETVKHAPKCTKLVFRDLH
jgi:hypothetical protein